MSEKKKILIVGGNGFVGTHLCTTLSKNAEVHATYRYRLTPVPGVNYHRFHDITDKDRVLALCRTVEPEVIIYSVGSNDATLAEDDQRLAAIAHSGGVAHFLMGADYSKAKFIYVSNDYVFSGLEGNYQEGQTTIPYNNLGKAKLGAENYVRSRSLNHVIIRSAPLLGRGTLDHPSFLDRIRISEMEGKVLSLSGQNFHNPVNIREFCNLVEKVIEYDLKNKTVHLGGLDKISEFELAKRFLSLFGIHSKCISEKEPPLGVNVKYDYSLNFTQTLKLLKNEPLSIKESLEALK